ncbi:hypothetical protein JIR001_12690 [Polycladomyces abyssicola]|uniref:Uncharacterized protein n=1 Tax=Polycladomyces abyssicola TaxID=1125966 RepID=A0A8D5UFE6_9BACL|nr:hypothetical protein JIR001_12690 [Polycladomyces abyssicola]
MYSVIDAGIQSAFPTCQTKKGDNQEGLFSVLGDMYEVPSAIVQESKEKESDELCWVDEISAAPLDGIPGQG